MIEMTVRPFAFFSDDQIIETNLNLNALVNRGLKFGDGIFETMRGSKGDVLYWKYHRERLLNGCQLLNLPTGNPDIFADEVYELLKAAIKKSEHPLQRLRLTVIRQGTGVGYAPTGEEVMIIIEMHPSERKKSVPLRLKIWNDFRIYPSELTRIKSLNRLPNVLGFQLFPENALILNHEGRIAEALNGNIFFIEKDDITLVTPLLSEGALDGVMRAVILEKTKTAVVRSIEPAELGNFSACFVTNVVQIIHKVESIEEHSYDTTHPLILEILLRL